MITMVDFCLLSNGEWYIMASRLFPWLVSSFEISHGKHNKIQSMEGIRGLAVFIVFVEHYSLLIEPWMESGTNTHNISIFFRHMGNAGVDLFFVLSGFLIYGMLISRKQAFLEYMCRRIIRIYPVFTVVFGMYVILTFAFPTLSKISAEENVSIYLLKNYLLLPGLFNIPPLISVAWSLSYEFFFYLVTPFFLWIMKLRQWNYHSRIVLLALTTFGFITYCILVNSHLIRMIMFLSGMLLFEMYANAFLNLRSGVGLMTITMSLLAYATLRVFDHYGWWCIALLYFSFIIFCLECFSPFTLAERIFSFRPLRWLGNMSYTFYLVHNLAIQFQLTLLSMIFPAEKSWNLQFFILFPLIFSISLLPTIIIFLSIERPFSLNLKQRRVQTDSKIINA